MTQRFLHATALTLALVVSNAAAAQTRADIATGAFARYPGWSYRQLHRCMAWDGYQLLNMCWRSRTFVSPAWARLH
jgi:hypothetical protein